MTHSHHGRRQGVARRCTCTPWNLKMMMSAGPDYDHWGPKALNILRAPYRDPHIDVETKFLFSCYLTIKNLVIFSRAFNKISRCCASAAGASENFQYWRPASQQLWGENLHTIRYFWSWGAPKFPEPKASALWMIRHWLQSWYNADRIGFCRHSHDFVTTRLQSLDWCRLKNRYMLEGFTSRTLECFQKNLFCLKF